jgi:antitoxin component YwqK of YwqJK toxin-antitoxin module
VYAQTQTDTIYKEYLHGNGKIASKGYLVNGKPEGIWKSYHMSGVKRSIGKWKNGKLDSTWIFFSHTGDTSDIINYRMGKKNGYAITFYPPTANGKIFIQSKELYVNDKRSGKAYHYFSNGQLKKIIPFSNDVKNGLAFSFDLDSNIVAITRYRNNQMILHEEINRYDENQKKTGVWKSFYPGGNIKEEIQYLNGKLNGVYKIYHNNGHLINVLNYENGEIVKKSDDFSTEIDLREKFDEDGNLIFQGSYLDQKPIGVHRTFDPEGNVIEAKTYNIYHQLVSQGIVTTDGKKEGPWIDYYPEGNKKAEGYYNNGLKNNTWIYYYPKGSVEQTGSYQNGKLSGQWKWYYRNGNLRKEEYFIFGLLDGEYIEYADSVLPVIIAKGNYIQGEKEGNWIYDIGDQKEYGKYVLGMKNGKWYRKYKSNDTLAFEGFYLQDLPDGKHIYYYPNQELKEIQYYDTGKKIKSWVKYDENGEIILVVQYRDDEIYKINGVKLNLTRNNDK